MWIQLILTLLGSLVGLFVYKFILKPYIAMRHYKQFKGSFSLPLKPVIGAFAFLKPPAADCAAIPVEVTIASLRVALPTLGPTDTTVEAFGYAKRSTSILG